MVRIWAYKALAASLKIARICTGSLQLKTLIKKRLASISIVNMCWTCRESRDLYRVAARSRVTHLRFMGRDFAPHHRPVGRSPRDAENIPGPLAMTKIALKPIVIGAGCGRTECTGAPCFTTHAPLMTKLSSGVDHVNLIVVLARRCALLFFSSFLHSSQQLQLLTAPDLLLTPWFTTIGHVLHENYWMRSQCLITPFSASTVVK